MFDLYGMGSPNVRKVAILLEELGLSYRFRHVDVFRAAQFEPEFLSLNPNGKVPVIVDHGAAGGPVTIFESGAILIFLAEKYGRFLPVEGAKRAEVMQWLMIQTCNFGPMLGQLNHFLFVETQGSDYARDRYRREARRLYRLLDERLSERSFLAAGEYSIADIATYPWAVYLERHELVPADYPHLTAWCARIGERAAVQKGCETVDKGSAQDGSAFETAPQEDLDRFFNRV